MGRWSIDCEEGGTKETPEQQQARFDQWDKNNDGKLTKDELPQNLQRNFARVDRDKDGFISRDEDKVFRDRLRQMQARRGANRRNPLESLKVTRDLPYADNNNPRRLWTSHCPPRSQTSRCRSLLSFTVVVGDRAARTVG